MVIMQAVHAWSQCFLRKNKGNYKVRCALESYNTKKWFYVEGVRLLERGDYSNT